MNLTRVGVRKLIFTFGALLLLWIILYVSDIQWKVFLDDSQESQESREQFQQSWNKSNRKFWESIQPAIQCDEKYLRRVGRNGDGGKWMCGLEKVWGNARNKPCTVFSFGVNGESSFEADILMNTFCKVYAFDRVGNSMGYPVPKRNLRAKFEQLAVGGEDRNNSKTIKTIMELAKVDWIDILKMDIEGAEFETLWKLINDFQTIPVGQLLVEIHSDNGIFRSPNGARTDKTVIPLFEKLQMKGLKLFHTEINNPNCCWEFSFLNTIVFSKIN